MYTNRYEVKEGNFNHSFICGALSGLVASFSIYPIDLMRTRFATRKYDNDKILATLRNLVRRDGAIVLFNGGVPNIMGILFYKGLGFYSLENLRNVFTKMKFSDKSVNFYAGALAGLIGQVTSYPFHVLKRKYMVVDKNEKMLVKQEIGGFGSSNCKDRGNKRFL